MALRLYRLRRTLLLQISENQREDLTEEELLNRAKRRRIYSYIKIGIFLIIWLLFAIPIIIKPPKSPHEVLVPLQPQIQQIIRIEVEPTGDFVQIILKGNFDVLKSPSSASENGSCIEVCLRYFDKFSNYTMWRSEVWRVYKPEGKEVIETIKNNFEMKGQTKLWSDDNYELQISVLNLYNESTGMSMIIESNPLDTKQGIVLGLILIIFLYTLIILDVTDRTFAALLTSTAAIGALSLLNSRPTLSTIVDWIDMETLTLLFSMMTMVAIISDTGVFDYLSVLAYQLSRGNVWQLLFYLCMFTGLLSSFLDNVTIVLLMVPVTIRLSEILKLNTILILISIAIFSNIGGTLTPVGDPPNVIIATNWYVNEHNIDFFNFTLHMFPGVLASMVFTYLMLYFMIRKTLRNPKESELLRSIRSLKQQLGNKKNSAEVNKNINRRIAELKEILKDEPGQSTSFHATLNSMKEKYRIKNMPLLIKSCICMIFTICMFFLNSLPFMMGNKLCWSSLLGALLLFIFANRANFESIVNRVEWSTLLFFGSLFILMESLVEMGLIDWLGELTISIVMSVNQTYQLTVAILLVLWISAAASAFVDNIPITTMMLKVAIKLATNNKMSLPFSPLIWALSYGTCFGGNGTLIGASANVVMAAIANQYGYTIHFYKFFILGFPIAIMTLLVCTFYLLIAHCAFNWHD